MKAPLAILSNGRASRLLSWALRLPSPTKAFAMGVQAEDGFLTFREAWTGRVYAPASKGAA